MGSFSAYRGYDLSARQRKIKRALDPDNILNPGKFL